MRPDEPRTDNPHPYPFHRRLLHFRWGLLDPTIRP